MLGARTMLRSALVLSATILLGCAAEPEAVPLQPARACTLMGCNSGVDFVVHLPTALTPRSLTACRGDVCVSAGLTRDVAWAQEGDGGRFAVNARCPRIELLAMPHGSRLDVQVSFRDREGVHCRMAHPEEGERVELRVDFVDGEPMIFERGVRFGDPYHPNGYECDAPQGYYCKRATFHVWPSSQSGLVCSGLPLESGAVLRAKVAIAATEMEGAVVQVCRNTTCALHKIDRFPCYPGGDSLASPPYPTLEWSCLAGRVEAFEVGIAGDAATLRDGDLYRFSLTKAGKNLFAGEKRVVYDRSWPNGERCDAYPQLSAVVEL